jgi:hypothetical protein
MMPTGDLRTGDEPHGSRFKCVPRLTTLPKGVWPSNGQAAQIQRTHIKDSYPIPSPRSLALFGIHAKGRGRPAGRLTCDRQLFS